MACTLKKDSREVQQLSNSLVSTNIFFCSHMTEVFRIQLNFFDLQFVHQVGAQVLSDVFMPGLPYPRRRERGGQVSHASHY